MLLKTNKIRNCFAAKTWSLKACLEHTKISIIHVFFTYNVLLV